MKCERQFCRVIIRKLSAYASTTAQIDANQTH